MTGPLSPPPPGEPVRWRSSHRYPPSPLWKGVEKELKQKKVKISMSLIFAKEEYTQELLDLCSSQMSAE